MIKKDAGRWRVGTPTSHSRGRKTETFLDNRKGWVSSTSDNLIINTKFERVSWNVQLNLLENDNQTIIRKSDSNGTSGYKISLREWVKMFY